MVWRWHTELSEFLGECVFSYRKIVKPYSWLVVACEYADVTARNEPYQCMVQTALNWTMAYATEQGRGLDSFWELGVKSRGEETLPKKRCPPPIYVNLCEFMEFKSVGIGVFCVPFIVGGGDILSCWCTALGYQQILSNGGSWFAIMRKETGNRETWTFLLMDKILCTEWEDFSSGICAKADIITLFVLQSLLGFPDGCWIFDNPLLVRSKCSVEILLADLECWMVARLCCHYCSE